jgi:hypothetical protein
MRYRVVNPDGPVRAECAATYVADDLLPASAYAFVFRVLDSDTRFTVYASAPDRYLINDMYRLTISEPTDVPLHLGADEAQFLRNCLLGVEDRWRDAMMQADAGATWPKTERPPEPGHLNIEPSPSGYRMIGNAFREELTRVQRLRERVDQLLAGLLNADGDQS